MCPTETAVCFDHTAVLYAGEMHGGDHDGARLPVALLGGTKAGLRADQHVSFTAQRPLRDLYFTLLNSFFGLSVPSFGEHLQNIPNQTVSEILG